MGGLIAQSGIAQEPAEMTANWWSEYRTLCSFPQSLDDHVVCYGYPFNLKSQLGVYKMGDLIL